jgi:hypothetical protein
MKKSCNERSGEGACPTHVEAVRFVRERIVREHSSDGCLGRCAIAAAAEPKIAPAWSADALTAMMAAQLAKDGAAVELHQAEQEIERTTRSLREATRAHEAATARLQAARVETERLTGKKQKKEREIKAPGYCRGWDITAWLHHEAFIHVVNSTELRAILPVKPRAPTVTPVLKDPPRRSPRHGGAKVISEPPPLPDDTAFEVQADADANARRQCW